MKTFVNGLVKFLLELGKEAFAEQIVPTLVEEVRNVLDEKTSASLSDEQRSVVQNIVHEELRRRKQIEIVDIEPQAIANGGAQ